MQGKRAESAPRYWALCANPSVYRIDDALAERTSDRWVSRGRHLAVGDRVLIWRTRGRDGRAGVVALGEVTSPPSLRDAENPYLVDPNDPLALSEQVDIDYVLPPRLPLWLDGPAGSLLRDLSVERARGGTVFNVNAQQWDAVVMAAGGWPSDVAEQAFEAMQALARPGSARGQRHQQNIAVRLAVERHAVALATAHYQHDGWTVVDVSARCSYDLHLSRSAEQKRVEVKGTVTGGTEVLLTPNEVAHARRHHPNVALFVVAHIAVADGEPPETTGGMLRIYDPWIVADDSLTPTGYLHRVSESGRLDVGLSSSGRGDGLDQSGQLGRHTAGK